MIAGNTLAEAMLSFPLGEFEIRERLQQIHDCVMIASRHLCVADFRAIHTRDLAYLFDAYDHAFFQGELRKALGQRSITFELSKRMTRAGGRTARITSRNGDVRYEIAIAISMLYDGFGEQDREATACGVQCRSRLEALQRIFEHELIHLAEYLAWGGSNCRGRRFQQIAARMFLHQSHTHNLITRRERAAQSGVRVGSLVSFVFEGRALTGKVNRITKRATVLVRDIEGIRYSDGQRYKRYYIPIEWLRPVEAVAVSA